MADAETIRQPNRTLPGIVQPHNVFPPGCGLFQFLGILFAHGNSSFGRLILPYKNNYGNPLRNPFGCA
jgi:hypothetical protein